MVKPLQAMTYDQLIIPTAATTATAAATFDCQDASYATIVVSLGTESNTNATGVVMALTESDDTVVTNFVTFDSSFARTVDDNTAAPGAVSVNHVDLKGRKRYLRITLTPDTTTNGPVTYSAIGILDKSVKTGTIGDYADEVAVG